MTQYGIRVTFDDEEKEALQAAIDHYLEVCRREIGKGASAPFLADQALLKRHFLLRKPTRRWPPNLPLGDGEWITVEAALTSYSEACERASANGETTPFSSHRATIANICKRVSDEFYRVAMEVEAIKMSRIKSKQ